MQKISLLGCGWLGLPLAESLIKKGFLVKGSTTTLEKIPLLQEKGILPYLVSITDTHIEAKDIADFLDSDILIINFPPKRRAEIITYHTKQFEKLIPEILKSKIQKILLISSTSVYPNTNKRIIVTEKETGTPEKESGKALLAVEKMLLDQIKFKTTIIRFSGLIGYDRMPGRFLAGKKEVENGEAPINVIHQDDCINIIETIINHHDHKEIWNDVFNASADLHPKRKEYYELAAEKIGLEKPTFAITQKIVYKIINSDKLKTKLGYQFKYPNPLDLLNQE
ncbi:SDR family NAD(P)-dependent oxidoreductase [Flavobacterium columnare]|uniref:SDR family NAD(P)-dependent oxidoreductase n=1 Tax=Flavobacterium columnare TaxID=996 RepID=UPI001BC87020|nr:SDR family NAD(P)-dependent oxidoreductase [Flavobacterium columnare]AUX17624.1 epimerase [Flavobacterium columnare]